MDPCVLVEDKDFAFSMVIVTASPSSIVGQIGKISRPEFMKLSIVLDRHYMPDGVPEPEASVHGNADEHRSSLKRKADGISRSHSEVFAYLTYNTSSLN